MIKKIKESAVKKMMPVRKKDSHKGENGRVMIVGGSVDFYGAPLLAALGALRSGADLVYLYVPECNFDAVRSYKPDFIVKKYSGDFLQSEHVDEMVEFGKQCGSVVIGPGLGDREETTAAVLKLMQELHIPMVLDAEAILALKKIDKFPLLQPVVITPHHNEFRNLVDRDVQVKESDPQSIILLRSIAMDLSINILLKGETDFVASEEGHVETNVTGNAGMTVGGSGDVLAGVVGSLLAQGLDGFEAARAAAFYNGKAGDYLQKKQGNGFLASELADALSYVI